MGSTIVRVGSSIFGVRPPKETDQQQQQQDESLAK